MPRHNDSIPIFALALLTGTGYTVERSKSMRYRFNIRRPDGELEVAAVMRGQLGRECALIRKRVIIPEAQEGERS
jgi:hypothetical protein